MKRLYLIIALLSSTTLIMAQAGGVAPLAKGQNQINFGLGFSGFGIPAYVSFDFAVHKDVTITPQVNVVLDDDVVWFGAMLKADYHWNYLIGIPNNWDFYSGARLGFLTGDDFELDLGLQIGGRWYWNESWALNLEFGGGTGFGTTLGVSKKF
ncbi:hypothetical protein [Fodinibius sp.]|uniref:hypothetical protein n=1 Tax=Fodinibius sp. TaxID=1872440 RepID=UPI0035621941